MDLNSMWVICVSPHCTTYSHAEFEVCLSYYCQLAAGPENSFPFNVESRDPTQLNTVPFTDRLSVQTFVLNFIIPIFIRYFEASPHTIGDLHHNLFVQNCLILRQHSFLFPQNISIFPEYEAIFLLAKETPRSIGGTSNWYLSDIKFFKVRTFPRILTLSHTQSQLKRIFFVNDIHCVFTYKVECN